MKDSKSCRVLVTSTSFGMNDASLRTDLEAAVHEVTYNPTGKPLTSSQLIDMIRGVDGIIAGLDFIDQDVIEAADQLKVIARYGVGLDRVDLEAAKRKGIVVTNTPGANATSVAELTVALMLALARNIPLANTRTKAGEWPRMKGLALSGTTIGLLGLGAIGRCVGQLLSGFDCRVIGYDPIVGKDETPQFNVEWVEKDAVIQESDFLSLHLPATPETENMVDSAFIALMKDGAYLVNTARSELIDEDALLAALRDGKLAGTALDTFREEPPSPGNALFQLDQVIATPHTGSHTNAATNLMGRMALDCCLTALNGGEPQYRVV